MARTLSGNGKCEAPAPWVRVCVTGGIACGKSMVGAFLEAMGVAVIEADAVCHDLMRAGMPLVPRLAAVFGREILASDGGINRAVLGRRVFGDAAALKQLNALLHPAAKDAIETWMDTRREENRQNRGPGWRGGAVAVVPLLYEAAWEAAWDEVLCVGAPMVLQRERLRSRGLTDKEIQDRVAAQWPVEEKMKRADYVVFNAGTPACARQQTVRIMQQLNNQVEANDGR